MRHFPINIGQIVINYYTITYKHNISTKKLYLRYKLYYFFNITHFLGIFRQFSPIKMYYEQRNSENPFNFEQL